MLSIEHITYTKVDTEVEDIAKKKKKKKVQLYWGAGRGGYEYRKGKT